MHWTCGWSRPSKRGVANELSYCRFRHCFCVFFWNEAMTRLVEIRNQEMLCRERALTEPERREFWLVQADEWAQRALNEIASDLHVMAHMGQATAKQDIRAL
jgi:hypothetical protein